MTTIIEQMLINEFIQFSNLKLNIEKLFLSSI